MSNKYVDALELMKSNLSKIVTVGLISGDEMLTGQRRDNQLWTSPGGHIDDGEDLLAAAKREVMEEAGLDVSPSDMHLVKAEKLVSHRTGKEFIVFAFLAHINKQTASAKADPDKEISEWRWVKISPESSELKVENRHAKDDFVLQHLGLHKPEAKMKLGQDPNDKGRTMKEVSGDIQKGHEKPAEPTAPEPKPKTPEELLQDPAESVRESDVTGD